jgi:type IV secretion system protein TrbE
VSSFPTKPYRPFASGFGRALGDGQSLGDFSLSIVLQGDSKQDLDQLAGEFTSVFTNADGNLFTETYNQLNAYFATVPGNYALNLRKLYLLNSNYADLSFLFTILPGEKRNAHLGTEYLAVLETENSTPYFLNLHNGEVAHTLILGMTGSGKSYFCNFLLQNAQKYTPLTFIFDIGGSFQSLTTIFGGSYLNVGQDTRDFTINPFSLAPTKENLQFLFSFFRVLIEGTEQRYRLDFKEERKLWDAVERVYVLEPGQRTISSFVNIIGELKERLHRWTAGGQYGFVFDNPEDTLSFSRFQTFNFAGWGDAPEVLEPLLFYVLPGVERDCQSSEACHLQDVSVGRGMAFHQERNDTEPLSQLQLWQRPRNCATEAGRNARRGAVRMESA